MSKSDSHDQAVHALRQANRAAKQGDFAGAERWSKAAARMAETAALLNEHAAASTGMSWEDEEAQRAELRRRLLLYVEADLDIQAWEEERDQHAVALAYGINPGPLRPHPAGPIGEEEYLRRIAMGEN